MATLGYGAYGFNVLGVNGETDSLPICRLISLVNTPIGAPAVWTQASDEFGMAIPAQPPNAGLYTTIRTPVAGIYEIEASMSLNGQGSSGVADVFFYVDKQINFDPTTGLVSVGNANSYVTGAYRISVATGTPAGLFNRVVVPLEKDCYITVYGGVVSGTAPRFNPQDSAMFTVRCVSIDPSPKGVFQTS